MSSFDIKRDQSVSKNCLLDSLSKMCPVSVLGKLEVLKGSLDSLAHIL